MISSVASCTYSITSSRLSGVLLYALACLNMTLGLGLTELTWSDGEDIVGIVRGTMRVSFGGGLILLPHWTSGFVQPTSTNGEVLSAYPGF